MSHRIGAIITLLVVGALSLRLLRDPLSSLRRLGRATGSILCLQLLLGLGNIVFQFPVWVATAHNAVGALLLMSMVTVNYYLVTARSNSGVGYPSEYVFRLG